MKNVVVILTIEEAAVLRKHLASPVHNEWLKRRMDAQINLRALGLNDEQMAAVQRALANN
jgi:hypothetical protein